MPHVSTPALDAPAIPYGAYDRRRGPAPAAPAPEPAPAPPPGAETAAARDAFEERALAPVYARGDQWMALLVSLHTLLALALAPVYGTWRASVVVAALAAGSYFAAWRLRAGSLFTRCVAGVALQAFCALHIYQLNGLAEMHFFYFTSVAALVLYQDWRAMWPGILAIIAQHTLFSVWHNEGVHPGGQRFFEPEHVDAFKLSWHYGLALAQSGIASYAAVVLRRRTLAEAGQREALAAQAAALSEGNHLLQEQTAELEVQATALHEQAAELQVSNEQLQGQQAELEAQAEALAEQTAAAEAARRELAATLERVGDGFFALDRQWRFTYVNARAEPLLGRRPDQLMGRVVWEEFPEAVGSTFWREYHLAVGTGEPSRFEEYFPPLDRWFSVAAYPGPDGLSVFFQDVTARRRAEERLREAEARFRLVQAASPDGFMLFRSVRAPAGAGGRPSIVDFEWLYTNSAGEQLVGRTHEALVGRRMLDVLPGNRAEGLFDAYADVVETGRPMRRELRYAHDGIDTWFAVTAVKVDDGFGVTFADVTARKLADAELERARRAAEEANRAKADFLANMSHELRTPLNAIGGYAELLQMGIRGPVTGEQAEDLGRIQRSQRHLLGLITDILNFARLEAGRVELRPAAVPAAELVEAVEAVVAPLVAAKGLRLVATADAGNGSGPLVAHADPDKARQILLNLVGNAVKFTDAGGEVRLEAGPGRLPDGAAAVAFRVRDTGRGIPADRLEVIFEPFVQVDRHKTQQSQQGVGLGLAISRDLARAMGGEVRAESVEGEGATFTVVLPAA